MGQELSISTNIFLRRKVIHSSVVHLHLVQLDATDLMHVLQKAFLVYFLSLLLKQYLVLISTSTGSCHTILGSFLGSLGS